MNDNYELFPVFVYWDASALNYFSLFIVIFAIVYSFFFNLSLCTLYEDDGKISYRVFRSALTGPAAAGQGAQQWVYVSPQAG